SRDIPFFHTPLRGALAAAAESGHLPTWNSTLNGGQPILSNPNYAAFYPPTWLLLLVTVPYSIKLLILLHVAWALWGSWRLLRQLGADTMPAACGAVSFALSPWYLGLASTMNFQFGMAWWPWIVSLAILGLDPQLEAQARRRACALAAGGLALQLFAGEPATVMITGLSLCCLFPLINASRSDHAGVGSDIGSASTDRVRHLQRLAGLGILATLLAAAQLVPTLHHLSGSPQRDASNFESRLVWSMSPLRLAEFLSPRVWGDPQQDEEGLFFGWNHNDRGFPYVISPYLGLLTTLLALIGLALWPLPKRGTWIAMALLGTLLALGRHLPLLGPLFLHLPILNLVRYPEKFIVLTSAALSVAGALGLHHLLSKLPARGPLLLVLGLVAMINACLVAVTYFRVDLANEFLLRFGGYPVPAEDLGPALEYFRNEFGFAFGIALTLALLVLLLPPKTLPRERGHLPWLQPWIGLLLFALLIGDLAHTTRTAFPTLSGEVFWAAPRQLAGIPAGSRLATTMDLNPAAKDHLRVGPVGFQQVLGRTRQLDPYVGNLWGMSYALNIDYDLMATRWAAHARQLYVASSDDPIRLQRIAETWNSDYLIAPRQRSEILSDLRRGMPVPEESRLIPLPERLPSVRSVQRVDSLSSAEQTIAWLDATADDWRSRTTCVETTANSARHTFRYESAAITSANIEGGHQRFTYRATAPAYVVVGQTFHPSWTARIVDQPQFETNLCPTALGQIGFAVPAGTHEVSLDYRDPWVSVGVAISLITLLTLSWISIRARTTSAA
ncbi:MAG: hypothetical protein K8J08_14795, partial [Thermoanaerobaculia bacterium]|nr:hypothetical protein [Thermoanaerobaculia bacterium]